MFLFCCFCVTLFRYNSTNLPIAKYFGNNEHTNWNMPEIGAFASMEDSACELFYNLMNSNYVRYPTCGVHKCHGKFYPTQRYLHSNTLRWQVLVFCCLFHSFVISVVYCFLSFFLQYKLYVAFWQFLGYKVYDIPTNFEWSSENPAIMIGHSLGCLTIYFLLLFLEEQRICTLQDNHDRTAEKKQFQNIFGYEPRARFYQVVFDPQTNTLVDGPLYENLCPQMISKSVFISPDCYGHSSLAFAGYVKQLPGGGPPNDVRIVKWGLLTCIAAVFTWTYTILQKYFSFFKVRGRGPAIIFILIIIIGHIVLSAVFLLQWCFLSNLPSWHGR